MRKVYNFLLITIIVLIIIVIGLIVIKYGKNRINEKEISSALLDIKQAGQNTTRQLKYKGFDVIGIIQIPKINIEYPILAVTTKETMRISITKFWGNGVNEVGNLCLAGHNNYDGTMFGKAKKLEVGDVINLTDLEGTSKQYKIYDKYITNPNDISITETKEFGSRELTLITCSNGNKERLIIKAKEI